MATLHLVSSTTPHLGFTGSGTVRITDGGNGPPFCMQLDVESGTLCRRTFDSGATDLTFVFSSGWMRRHLSF